MNNSNCETGDLNTEKSQFSLSTLLFVDLFFMAVAVMGFALTLQSFYSIIEWGGGPLSNQDFFNSFCASAVVFGIWCISYNIMRIFLKKFYDINMFDIYYSQKTSFIVKNAVEFCLCAMTVSGVFFLMSTALQTLLFVATNIIIFANLDVFWVVMSVILVAGFFFLLSKKPKNKTNDSTKQTTYVIQSNGSDGK